MKRVELRLLNAKIPRKSGISKAGIAIENGKIESISKKPSLPDAERTINLEGSLLLPGVVDTHVHFRDPGLTQKEDFSTGSKAAAAGGVTTICDMPNTSPPTNSLSKFSEKREIAENKSFIDFGLHAMIVKSSKERKKISDAGVASFKLYPELSDDTNISNFTENDIVSIHPENPSILKEEPKKNNETEKFIQSRPKRTETSEIKRTLKISTKPHLHYCHVTTRESLKIISKERRKRRVTCEVTPHHLLLDQSNLRESGTIAKTYPPLRSKEDRRSLLNGVKNGLIDMVATDHAPHTKEEKERGMMDAPPGIAGIETSLPLLFTLVKEDKLSLSRLIEIMSLNPAKIFGLQNNRGIQKGTLTPGADADFVVMDQNKKWEIRGANLHGKTKFTPFEGREVTGKPIMTIVRGKIVFRDGSVVGSEGYGNFVPREL